MIKVKRWAPFLGFALGVILTCGCGVTLSPIKRTPLRVASIETDVPSYEGTAVVSFDSVLPNKKLSETVWDNVTGPFWDVEESQQIGFTQNYGKLALVSAGAGAVGGAAMTGVAMGAAVQSGQINEIVETRIVIPFGRIFSEIFLNGMEKCFSSYQVCFDASCDNQSLASGSIIKINVENFRVWEDPLNHLNFIATVVTDVHLNYDGKQADYSYTITKELQRRSIGSVWTTSSGFIKEMNRLVNNFAIDISIDILSNLYSKKKS